MHSIMLKFTLPALLIFTVAVQGQINEQCMPGIRQMMARHIKEDQPQRYAGEKSAQANLEKLSEQGIFTDVALDKLNPKSTSFTAQRKISTMLREAFFRLRDIAWCYNNGLLKGEHIKERVFKSAVYYSNMELRRIQSRARWPFSPFLYPYCASVIYFSFFDDMEAVESGKSRDKLSTDAAKALKAVAFQAFTQPLRNDVKGIYSIDRFRNSSQWVGGNFSYRRPFINAATCNDPRMLNLVWEACNKAISHTSFNTLDKAFWTEGLTSDGAAWGHGRQSYAFGYGLDGIGGVLRTLKLFKDTGLKETELSREQFDKLFNFADGMSWLQFRERGNISVTGRHNFLYNRSNYIKRIEQYLERIKALEPPEEVKIKISALQQQLENSGEKLSAGVKYFWNNDDLVMRGNRYNVFVNMISSRSVGPETVPSSSNAVNYNMADGTALILKRGDEYDYSPGGWNFAIPPGATARDTTLPDKDMWRGFTTVHNFAGGVGGDNGVAGFILEKAVEPGASTYNFKELLGVKAYKSYFMFPGFLITLGAGIENLTPEQTGNIITCVNQTQLQGELQIKSGGITRAENLPYSFTEDLSALKEPLMLRQRDIDYVIYPGTGTVSVSGEKRQTRWAEINKRNSKLKSMRSTVDMFSITIDHGHEISNGSYHYMAALNCSSFDELNAVVSSGRFSVISNSTQIQGIYDSKAKCAQMVIFDPQAEAKIDGMKISSSHAAVIRLQNIEANRWLLSVADPTQNPNLKSITIRVNGKMFELELASPPYCGRQTDMEIVL